MAAARVKQRDLVDVLDLARLQHDLLAVLDLEAGLLQLEHHRRLDDVDADRHLVDAGFAQQRGDFLGVIFHQAEARRHGAAQADEAGLAMLLQQPRRIEPVVHGGRAEIPDDRLLALGEQREAGELVALPFADLGRGHVADVVDVEQQQRAEVGALQRLARAGDAVAAHAVELDAALEVHAHGAPGGQMPVPAVMRVEVVGLGPLLAHDLVHGGLLHSSSCGVRRLYVIPRRGVSLRRGRRSSCSLIAGLTRQSTCLLLCRAAARCPGQARA